MTDISQGPPGAKVEGIFTPGPAHTQTEKVTLGDGRDGVLYIVRTPSSMAVTFWGVPDFVKMLDDAREKVTGGLRVASHDDVATILHLPGPKDIGQ